MSNVCGTGGWNGPQPGDPDNNSVLSASPAFGGIDVSWTYPGVNPHAVAHTILYRGISSDFGTALQREIVNGSFFYDKVDADITYFYWIRFISIHGTEGQLIGPVSAQARPLIEDLIEQLTDKIDSGVLAQSLKAKLDDISIINSNLLNEIYDRETGQTSLAQAIADAQAGVAESLAFIQTEIAHRTTADEALAESISLVGVTLGDDYAAVTQQLAADIQTVNGKVTEIGALWTAKVTVNDLIGGFGVYNDGQEVEAGFDVDRFWVGRTGANKRKPFIIQDNETFIDEAVINQLTFSKLRDEGGAFIVENGRVKADYLRVNSASIEDASITNAKIANAAITNAKIGNAQVDTLKIGNNAVTVPVSSYSAGQVYLEHNQWTPIQSVSITCSGARIYLNFTCEIDDYFSYEEGGIDPGTTVTRYGKVPFQVGFTGVNGQFVTSRNGVLSFSEIPAAGTYTFTVYGRTLPSNQFTPSTRAIASCRSLFIIETKR